MADEPVDRTPRKATEVENRRYIQGLCVDCGEVPYSAGRPRCTECHLKRGAMPEPGLKRDPTRRPRRRW